MFFPFGDTPNPQGFRPWVTWVLIALNVLAYLVWALPLSTEPIRITDPEAQAWVQALAPSLPEGLPPAQLLLGATAYDLFTFAHGYKPAAPELSDLFSSIFLHAGLLHLAGNMLMLWIYGDNVEHRLGRPLYLLAYLGTGVLANLAFAALSPDSMVPLVGASGAISGVLGMYALWFPRNQVKVFVALFPFFMRVVLVPAWLVLGIFVLMDNVLPLLAGAGGGVAYGAHLGGFFAGMGVAALVSWTGFGLGPAGRPAVRRAVRQKAVAAAPPTNRRLAHAAAALETGRLWLQEGYPVAAWQQLVRAVQLDPDGPIGQEARELMDRVPGVHRRSP